MADNSTHTWSTLSSLADYCSTDVRSLASCLVHLVEFFFLNLFLDLVQQFSSSFDDNSEELSSFDLLGSDRDSVIPDANYEHNVFDFHFLQEMEELLSCAVFTIVVEAFRHHFSLGDLVKLRDSVGKDSISGSWKLGVGGVVHVVEVVHHELHLVLVGNGGGECLELELLDLLRLAITDGFNDCIKIFLILR